MGVYEAIRTVSIMREGSNGYSASETFDFLPLGQAIKRAREARGITREQLAEQLDYAPRHLQSIENKGQHPSFQLFVQLVTMFNISADQFIFPDRVQQLDTHRRQVDELLDLLDDRDLTVVENTIMGLLKIKK